MPISNLTQFKRQLKQTHRAITNLRSFFRGQAVPTTIAEIRRLIYRQGIIKTGTYLGAATQPGHAAHIQNISEHEMEIGVNLDWFERNRGAGYPLFLEKGTRRMKARPVYSAVAGSETYGRKIDNLYEKWAQQQIERLEK